MSPTIPDAEQRVASDLAVTGATKPIVIKQTISVSGVSRTTIAYRLVVLGLLAGIQADTAPPLHGRDAHDFYSLCSLILYVLAVFILSLDLLTDKDTHDRQDEDRQDEEAEAGAGR